MIWPIIFSLSTALADEPVLENIASARASISQTERQQREVLSQLFTINKKIKQIATTQARLSEKMFAQEATVKALAQEVRELEGKSDQHREMLNRRLRRLYEGRSQTGFQWLFSAQTPLELEQHRRYLKKMVDSDHHYLKLYLANLGSVKQKRDQLKGKVARLLQMQKGVKAQETLLAREQKEKSRLMGQLNAVRDSRLGELKDLREKHQDLSEALSLAFFEHKGNLPAPVEARPTREYGAFVDPAFRFRLMLKGFFYSGTAQSAVKSVFAGKVVFAQALPGFGKTVIVDHGDNYYTVYAFASKLAVHKGAEVREGETLAWAGARSPLFGPGLYFEIRHFTEAIDPRGWIKEPVIKTANTF